MIDFAGLVAGPNVAIFARPVTVIPIVSQPGRPGYPARGIWSSKPVDVAMDDGSIASSQAHTLDVRASEFTVPLAQGDRIEIPEAGSLPRIGIVLIEDGDDDGQGMTSLSVKVIAP